MRRRAGTPASSAGDALAGGVCLGGACAAVGSRGIKRTGHRAKADLHSERPLCGWTVLDATRTREKALLVLSSSCGVYSASTRRWLVLAGWPIARPRARRVRTHGGREDFWRTSGGRGREHGLTEQQHRRTAHRQRADINKQQPTADRASDVHDAPQANKLNKPRGHARPAGHRIASVSVSVRICQN